METKRQQMKQQTNPQPQRQMNRLEASFQVMIEAINLGQQSSAYTLQEAANIHVAVETVKAYMAQPKADQEVLLKFGQFLMKQKGYKKEVTLEDIQEFAKQGSFEERPQPQAAKERPQPQKAE